MIIRDLKNAPSAAVNQARRSPAFLLSMAHRSELQDIQMKNHIVYSNPRLPITLCKAE